MMRAPPVIGRISEYLSREDIADLRAQADPIDRRAHRDRLERALLRDNTRRAAWPVKDVAALLARLFGQ